MRRRSPSWPTTPSRSRPFPPGLSAAAVFLAALILPSLLMPLPAGAARTPRAERRPARAQEETPAEPAATAPALRIPADLAGRAAAEQALDSLRARFTDGRMPLSLPVSREDEGAYVALGDFSRLAGGGYRWNPETWRGGVRVDSTEIDFVLDTAVVWMRGQAVQLPAPVRYAGESVRIPVVLIDAALVPLLGDRCRWDPRTGSLEIAPPRPWLDSVTLTGGGSAATLSLDPAAAEQTRLRWDPAGRLRIEEKGVHLPPGFRAGGRVEGCAIAALIPTALGFEVVLDLDPGWQGLRLHPGRGPNSIALDLTARSGDLDRGRFQSLDAYLTPPPRQRPADQQGRRVLLEVGSGAQGAGAEALQTLRDQLVQILEKDFGHEVIEVADRSAPGRLTSPSGLPETPPLPEGDCWVGLRLESWPGRDAREFLLVVPGEAAREEPVATSFASAGGAGGAMAGGARMIPWGQVSRLFRDPSEKLARTIADHLNHEWNGRPIAIASRPARLFRGLAVPAVLVYPAAAGDEDALAALSDPARASELARNVAFALDEFLMGYGRE